MHGPVEIKKVVYGGLGLAHFEDRTLFIPFTAPGDRVTFELTSEKKKCLFGMPVAIETPSPSRIEPECPVFGRCGGCHMLHMGYADELGIKRETVVESLERIGRIKIEISGVTPCPSRFGYRNNTLFRVDERGKPGFLRHESTEVVPFPDAGCLLLPDEMRTAISSLPAESLVPGSEVRVRLDRYGTVHFWGLRDRVSPPDLLMEAGGFQFPVMPDSFFQVNRLLNGALIEKALSLPTKARRNLLDLYCGCGFFTFPFSAIVEKAVGIERDPGSYRSGMAAKRLNATGNITFRNEIVEKEIFRVREADLVVVDPPRSGMPAAAMKGLVKLRPEEIIMISCEPPTFSRDAAKLIEAGYSLSSVHVVDMFPGTYHVETLGHFLRS